MRWKRAILAVLSAVGLCTAPALATIDVYLNPSNVTVYVGDLFTVDVLADIPEMEPILGWGLDLTFDNPWVQQIGGPTVGPLWIPAAAPDGDGLAGVAFPPPGLWGDHVPLASITLQAVAMGTVNVGLDDDNPPDLTEGFALDPVGFAEVNYVPGTITIIPEPATLALLIAGSVALLRRRR